MNKVLIYLMIFISTTTASNVFIRTKEVSNVPVYRFEQDLENQKTLKTTLAKFKKENTFKNEPTSKKKNNTSKPTTPTYKNGTYQSHVDGYLGVMIIQVLIENHKIASIEILSHKDTKLKVNYAASKIIPEVIEKGHSNIDLVSTASYSSEAIIKGINACLNQARER